jgi:hypothetical protein
LINITKLKRKTLSQNGDRPQEYLAKFGYRPDTKLEKFFNPAIFWLPVWVAWNRL